MTLKEFSEIIEADIDWRIGQFASLKAIPVLYCMDSEHRALIQYYSVPAIYALWEGFIVSISHNYVKFINECNISVNNIHLFLLTHALNSKFKLCEGRNNTTSQREFIGKLYNSLTYGITIPTKISTESNVNYKVLNNILDCFNLEKVDNHYESKLNKLLEYRNRIAHGEQAVIVTEELIFEFTQNIESLMSDVLLIFMDGITNDRYMAMNDLGAKNLI